MLGFGLPTCIDRSCSLQNQPAMCKVSTGGLLSRSLFRSLVQPSSSVTTGVSPWKRILSHSARRDTTPPRPEDIKFNAMESLARTVWKNSAEGAHEARLDIGDRLQPEPEVPQEPYHFHIYSHRHNTHVTVTKPNRDAIISLSCGNLGFRKAGRKHYDAAYQLGAYVVDKLHQMGVVKEIRKLEVVLRGFGAGREAVLKVLLGNEGKMLRGKIIRVADATRIKFGGTRSPNPRRLG